MNALGRFFQFEQHGTTFSREVIAGLTTFTTMSYIVVVNPAILSNAGIPAGPSFVATVVAAVFGCTLMGLYANRPFAIAPYMGENAFIAFTVCGQLGYKWQTALAAIFIAGVLFVLLTVFRLRQWVVEAVPLSLRYSFAVGIGLFLTFIGLNQTGIVTLGVAGAPVRAGPSHQRACAGGDQRLSIAFNPGDPQSARRYSAGHCRDGRDCLCSPNRRAASALQ